MKTNQHIKGKKSFHTLIYESTIQINQYVEYELLLNMNKGICKLIYILKINFYMQIQSKKEKGKNEEKKQKE